MQIDNSDLLKGSSESNELRPQLTEGKDYEIVTEKAWTQLAQWYGGGPAIPRDVVFEGLGPTKKPRVMLYPLQLEVVCAGKSGNKQKVNICKTVSRGRSVARKQHAIGS